MGPKVLAIGILALAAAAGCSQEPGPRRPVEFRKGSLEQPLEEAMDLLENGGFDESDERGRPSAWEFHVHRRARKGPSPAVLRFGEDRSGDRRGAAELAFTDWTAASLRQPFTPPGRVQRLRLEGWARGSEGFDGRLFCSVGKVPGVLVGAGARTAEIKDPGARDIPVSAGWARFSLDLGATEEAEPCVFFLALAGGPGSIWLDGVSLTPSP
ncbi:MAG: hypothetical protein HY721_30565 [Planctomycetes bacterium]|nr:hypothetical protein [Planctomycetota bacterium]